MVPGLGDDSRQPVGRKMGKCNLQRGRTRREEEQSRSESEMGFYKARVEAPVAFALALSVAHDRIRGRNEAASRSG